MIKHQGKTAKEWAEIAQERTETYTRLLQQIQEDLQAIYAKQQRDNTERVVQFRVSTITETTTHGKGTPADISIDVHRDELTDYDTAQKIADIYDGAEIQARTTTPWKTVTPSHTPDTGN